VIVQGTSVGLDVHALSVVAHAVDEETGKIARARLCPDHGEVLGWLHQLRSPVRVTYEAGPTGFGLARAITEAGMQWLVAAPSKLQRSAGDRIKTDARDAAHLARLLRLGEITPVRVPEREIEAVRDLVRAREDARADQMRVRHRLSKLLLRQGIVYSGGTPWTCEHEEWLRRHRFADTHLKAAFDHCFDAVLAATAARDRLDDHMGGGRNASAPRPWRWCSAAQRSSDVGDDRPCAVLRSVLAPASSDSLTRAAQKLKDT
jgi:transposase